MTTHQIQITELQVFPIHNRNEGKPLQAFVRIILNNALVINGIRVINGKFGPFIAFPCQKAKGSTICFPIRKDLHEEMSSTILNEYRSIMSVSEPKTKEGGG